MNDFKRKKLNKAVELLQNAWDIVDEVKSDEETCFDSLPEKFADSERGQKFEEAIDRLDETLETISSAIDEIWQASS